MFTYNMQLVFVIIINFKSLIVSKYDLKKHDIG